MKAQYKLMDFTVEFNPKTSPIKKIFPTLDLFNQEVCSLSPVILSRVKPSSLKMNSISTNMT